MANGTFVRRNVWTLPSGDQTLEFYARAVEVMRGRDESDPTSWAYQAAIHGRKTGSGALWNECKHGSWFFLPWHRMFVYYFERIVRAAVVAAGGPSNWALPYWGYGNGGEQASLPHAFRASASAVVNPLFVQERAEEVNAGVPLDAKVITHAFALSRLLFTGAEEFGGGIADASKQFWRKTGRLEQTPHNDVHNAVGGKGGWMADAKTAAQDPIFWLHHANIDRIWAIWNAIGRVDPGDQEWREQRFDFFDADGSRVSKACADVIDIATLEYTYDPPPIHEEPTGTRPFALAASEPRTGKRVIVGASISPIMLTGHPAEATVEIDSRASAQVEHALPPGVHPRVVLAVEDIEGEENPGTVYGIYVDLSEPASEEELTSHHVGNLSFFGLEDTAHPREGEDPHTLRVAMEITGLVEALKERDRWDPSRLEVTFRPLLPVKPGEPAPAEPVDYQAEGAPVRVGRISVAYE